MKNAIIYILVLIAVGEIATLIVINSKPKPSVLSQTVTATPFPVTLKTQEPTPLEVSPTPSPTPSPTATPVAVNTATPTPHQPLFTSQEIYQFIERFSTQYGVDPNIIRHIAVCESGFNPAAFNLGYAGLFQFGSSTWKNWRVKMGEDISPDLRFNAEEAIQTAVFAFKEGGRSLWPNCTP